MARRSWRFPGFQGNGNLDLDRAHDLINHLTAAFLLDVLKGDPEANKVLMPDKVKFEEVQYTATWK